MLLMQSIETNTLCTTFQAIIQNIRTGKWKWERFQYSRDFAKQYLEYTWDERWTGQALTKQSK